MNFSQKDKKQIKNFLTLGLTAGLVSLAASSELVSNPVNTTSIISGLAAISGVFGAAYKTASLVEIADGITLGEELKKIKQDTVNTFNKINELFDNSTDSILALRNKFKPQETPKTTPKII